MKKNLCIPKVHSMYTSLANEAWKFWNVDRPVPPLRVQPLWRDPFFGYTSEYWDASMEPATALAQTSFHERDMMNATHISMNVLYLPHLYEDEVICTILHELAHAYCGLMAQHGPEWQRAAEEIGSYPKAVMIPRAMVNHEISWIPENVVAMNLDYFKGVPSLGFC